MLLFWCFIGLILSFAAYAMPKTKKDEHHLKRDFMTQLHFSDRCGTSREFPEKATTFMQFLVSSPEQVKSCFQYYLVIYTT